MYVIEVKPKKTWRCIRLSLDHDDAWATPKHAAGTHFFTRDAAAVVDNRWPSLRYNGNQMTIPLERRRIVECECWPSQLK